MTILRPLIACIAIGLFALPASAINSPQQICENAQDQAARLLNAEVRAYDVCSALVVDDLPHVPEPDCLTVRLQATSIGEGAAGSTGLSQTSAVLDPWEPICGAVEDVGETLDDLGSPDCISVSAAMAASAIDPWPPVCNTLADVGQAIEDIDLDCLGLKATDQRAQSTILCLLLAVIREALLGNCNTIPDDLEECIQAALAQALDEVPQPGGTRSGFCYSIGATGQDVICAWSGNYATLLADDACPTAPGPGEHCYEFGSSNGGGALGAGIAQGIGIHRPTLCSFSGSLTIWDECTDSESLFTEGGLVHPETYGNPNSCHVTESKAVSAPWPPAEAIHETCW